MVELVVGTVGTVGTVGAAVVVVLAVAHTAELVVDIAAAEVGPARIVEDTDAVAHHSLAAAAEAIAAQCLVFDVDFEV